MIVHVVFSVCLYNPFLRMLSFTITCHSDQIADQVTTHCGASCCKYSSTVYKFIFTISFVACQFSGFGSRERVVIRSRWRSWFGDDQLHFLRLRPSRFLRLVRGSFRLAGRRRHRQRRFPLLLVHSKTYLHAFHRRRLHEVKIVEMAMGGINGKRRGWGNIERLVFVRFWRKA